MSESDQEAKMITDFFPSLLLPKENLTMMAAERDRLEVHSGICIATEPATHVRFDEIQGKYLMYS